MSDNVLDFMLGPIVIPARSICQTRSKFSHHGLVATRIIARNMPDLCMRR